MMGNSVVLLATGVSYEFAMIKRLLVEDIARKMDFTFILNAAIRLLRHFSKNCIAINKFDSLFVAAHMEAKEVP